MLQYEAFDPTNTSQTQAIATIWTQACGPELAISPRFVRFSVRPSTGVTQTGRLVYRDGEAVAFVLASAMADHPQVNDPQVGFIDALAVRPASHDQGIASGLLTWAEEWLAGQGCTRFRLGSSIRPFVPGLPVSLGTDQFFARRGYSGPSGHERAWDVARRLSDYVSPPSVRRELKLRVAAAEPDQAGALRDFLQREFPGRWHYEFEEFLREGGRIGDYVALWSERGVDGVARLTYEDSLGPIDRFFPYRLPRPWGQLGSIGVSADRRGIGYGAVLLDGGLRLLRARNVDGCVIDWTGIVDFYGKFGFKPYREYLMWGKAK